MARPRFTVVSAEPGPHVETTRPTPKGKRPTRARVLDLLMIAPSSERQFRWRSPKPGVRQGQIAGGKYGTITIDGTQYHEYELMWFVTYHRWPLYELRRSRNDKNTPTVLELVEFKSRPKKLMASNRRRSGGAK